jgi:hypothetical protein
MGLVSKSSISDDWDTNGFITTPAFHFIMSRNRFNQILQYLHFSDALPSKNKQSHIFVSNNPLEKVEKIMRVFVEKWKRGLKIGQNIVIDESMCGFGATLAFKQYLPQKAHKWDIKFFHVACARTSYIFNAYVYTGKKNSGTCDDMLKLWWVVLKTKDII